uniref:Uncharacterized protein n=1 Tax=Anguilla anguilla TaxID=7936 RepID=A0A0E9T2K5_ANGAN
MSHYQGAKAVPDLIRANGINLCADLSACSLAGRTFHIQPII